MEFKNRELTNRPLFPVGVNIFVIRNGKLLLGSRRNPHYHDGEWGLPGGHLEEGEKMEACGLRELKEEIGLTAESLEFAIADNDLRQEGFHYVHFGFVAHGVSGEVELKEPEKCYRWEWFDTAKLPENLFIGHKKLILGFLEKRLFIDSA